MKSNSAFAARLREAIRSRGMSQTELARQLSVRDATVSEWLNRGTVPNGTVMLRLPAILAVDGHWLLTGERRSASARSAPQSSSMNESEREHVATLLEIALDLLRREQVGGSSETLAEGRHFRVREANEDEALALEAIASFQRERQAQRTGQARRQQG